MAEITEDKLKNNPESRYQPKEQFSISHEDELIRLSTMLLLRYLPDHKPLFDQHLKGNKIDCVLEPLFSELPFIVLEAKSKIVSEKHFDTVIKQLKSIMSSFGKNKIGVIVIENILIEFNREKLGKNIFLLVFDVRRNQFINRDFHKLIDKIFE